MPVAALLILSTAAALKPSLAPPLQPTGGPHGLPLLPSGESLVLDAPGWTRGIGTGGRVWPAATGKVEAGLVRPLANHFVQTLLPQATAVSHDLSTA